MTQQTPNLVIEPQPCRHALVSPGAEGLLRPEPGRNLQGLLRHGKRSRFRYPGLLHPVSHRKYAGFQRSTAHGGTIRMLSSAEIEEWYARVTAVQRGKHAEKPIGPLDEKSRR